MWELLKDIVGKAQSELFLFLVLITIVLILLLRPIYKQRSENEKIKRDQDMEYYKQVIQVIQNNSAVMTELKTIIIVMKEDCVACKQLQTDNFNHLTERLIQIKDKVDTL